MLDSSPALLALPGDATSDIDAAIYRMDDCLLRTIRFSSKNHFQQGAKEGDEQLHNSDKKVSVLWRNANVDFSACMTLNKQIEP
jgi:hypothetical protein